MTISKLTTSFIESAAHWSGVVTVAATVIAALAGSVSWYFSKKAAEAKDAELNRFKIESRVAISQADARAAEANKKAEESHLDRVKLEESIASRRLTKDQRNQVTSNLRSFSGQIVSFWYGAGDKEAETFAYEIATALHDARWKVMGPATIMTMASARPFETVSPMETGVTVVSTGDEPSLNAASALVQELLVIGYDATKSPKIDERDARAVLVTVEARPEGSQGRVKVGANSK